MLGISLIQVKDLALGLGVEGKHIQHQPTYHSKSTLGFEHPPRFVPLTSRYPFINVGGALPGWMSVFPKQLAKKGELHEVLSRVQHRRLTCFVRLPS